MSVSVLAHPTLVNNEQTVVKLPKIWRGNGTKLGVVQLHGHLGGAFDIQTPGSSMVRISDRIAEMDHPVVGLLAGGGNTWGNAAGQAGITSALAYLASIGCRSDKLVIMAGSMGHLNAMNWAANNKTKIAGVISLSGVADLNNINGDLNYYRGQITAAYGGNLYTDAALGSSFNPSVSAASKFSGLKWLGIHGTSDVTVPITTVRNLRDAIGPTATLIEVAGAGHSLDSVLGNYLTDITNFIESL